MKKLKIALVAHDLRKHDMIEWAVSNAEFLKHHQLICTGTTGTLLKEAYDERGIEASIERVNSGPMGGDVEIANLVINKQIDCAVFLIDDLNTQPHEADIMMLLRQCRLHNIPIACNCYTADLIVNSTLWNDESYQPKEPTYCLFDREAFLRKNSIS